MELFLARTFGRNSYPLYVVATDIRTATDAVEEDSGNPPEQIERIDIRVLVIKPKR
jgi:hypothetical protein